MSGFERHRLPFYESLRSSVASVVRLSAVDFNERWARLVTSADQPWLSQTSSFNIDTWLLRAVCEEFAGFELLANPKIQKVFFDHQALFNSRLIGTEFDYRLHGGT